MKEAIEKVVGTIGRVEKTIILILLPIMCIVIFINTVARYTGMFTDQLIWAEEFARYIMIWMSMVGAGYVFQEGGHYRMSAIVDGVPKKLGDLLKAIALLITIILLVFLAKIGFDMCSKLISTGQTSPVLKIPMWIPYLSIPVGMCLCLFHQVMRIVLIVLTQKEAGESK